MTAVGLRILPGERKGEGNEGFHYSFVCSFMHACLLAITTVTTTAHYGGGLRKKQEAGSRREQGGQQEAGGFLFFIHSFHRKPVLTSPESGSGRSMDCTRGYFFFSTLRSMYASHAIITTYK